MAQVTGYADRPMHPGGFADPMIAMHAGVALQAALEHRDRTGEGQMIEVAQLETAAVSPPTSRWTSSSTGASRRDTGNRDTRMAPQGVYQCRDGRVGRAQRAQRRRLARLLEALDRPLWATDDFATLAGRLAPPRRPRPARGGVVRRARRRLRDRAAPRARPARSARCSARRPCTTTRSSTRASGTCRSRTRRRGCAAIPAWPVQFSFAKAAHRFGPPTLGPAQRRGARRAGSRARGDGPARGRRHHRRPDGEPLGRIGRLEHVLDRAQRRNS